MIYIVIACQEREEALQETLRWLPLERTIVIVDGVLELDVENHQTVNRHGKELFFETWNLALRAAMSKVEDHFCFLEDDWTEIDTVRIEQVPEHLPEPFACNAINVGWKMSWTGYQSHHYDGLFDKVGYIEQGMITTKEVIRELHPLTGKYFKPNASSGVGKEMSKRLLPQIPMYRPKDSMAAYQYVPSIMHPERDHSIHAL